MIMNQSHYNYYQPHWSLIVISVQLIGGGRGNVYATNPTNQFFGPICDDAWDIAAVTYHYLSVTKSLKYQHQQQAQYGF